LPSHETNTGAPFSEVVISQEVGEPPQYRHAISRANQRPARNCRRRSAEEIADNRSLSGADSHSKSAVALCGNDDNGIRPTKGVCLSMALASPLLSSVP
jgi:hypothetical protein